MLDNDLPGRQLLRSVVPCESTCDEAAYHFRSGRGDEACGWGLSGEWNGGRGRAVAVDAGGFGPGV